MWNSRIPIDKPYYMIPKNSSYHSCNLISPKISPPQLTLDYMINHISKYQFLILNTRSSVPSPTNEALLIY